MPGFVRSVASHYSQQEPRLFQLAYLEDASVDVFQRTDLFGINLVVVYLEHHRLILMT